MIKIVDSNGTTHEYNINTVRMVRAVCDVFRSKYHIEIYFKDLKDTDVIDVNKVEFCNFI